MVDAEIQELVKPDDMPPLQWEWWKEWWERDYSWNSDRFKPYKAIISEMYMANIGGGDLEVYLKAEGQLVSGPGGELFHICWLPPYWRNGAQTEFYSDDLRLGRECGRSLQRNFRGVTNFEGLTAAMALVSVWHAGPFNGTYLEKCFFGGRLLFSSFGGTVPIGLNSCLIVIDSTTLPTGTKRGWSVNFEKTLFSVEPAKISKCRFDQISFSEALDLSGATIEGDVDFQSCNFSSEVVTVYGGNTLAKTRSADDLTPEQNEESLSFIACEFFGPLKIASSKGNRGLYFLGCEFKELVDASEFRVGRHRVLSCSFADSTFKRKVLICDENLIDLAPAFTDATLTKGIDFGVFESVINNKFFEALKDDLRSLSNASSKRANAAIANPNEISSAFDKELLRLISGVRVIRLASQSSGDKLSESQLHALELAAYQRLSTTRAASEFFASAYGWLSDYGCSLLKPFVWLLVLMVVSSIGYATLNESAQKAPFTGQLSWPEVLQGLLYSFSRVIPIGPWQDLVFADSILSTGKGASAAPSSPQKVAVVLLATAQSFFSTILLFLFGLAARRKFQVG
jgi:hypothetical protein